MPSHLLESHCAHTHAHHIDIEIVLTSLSPRFPYPSGSICASVPFSIPNFLFPMLMDRKISRLPSVTLGSSPSEYVETVLFPVIAFVYTKLKDSIQTWRTAVEIVAICWNQVEWPKESAAFGCYERIGYSATTTAMRSL